MGKPYPNRSVTLGVPRFTKKNILKLKTHKLFGLMSAVSCPSPLHLAIPVSSVLTMSQFNTLVLNLFTTSFLLTNNSSYPYPLPLYTFHPNLGLLSFSGNNKEEEEKEEEEEEEGEGGRGRGQG